MKSDLITDIPEPIASLVRGKNFTADRTGLSGAYVYIFDEYVLKCEPYSENITESIGMMRWLDGKIPAPKVIGHCVSDGMSFLLMSRINGVMSCDERFLEDPDLLTDILAQGLEMLWSTDISDCPRDRGLDAELYDARIRVEKGLIDTEKCQPDTFGKNGFKDPAQLLEWLENNRPPCEPVLSHGDFCLPNIFIENGRLSGFIDLGDCGIADKWRDISLCFRSLRHNCDGTFGGRIYDTDPCMLFEKLGITPDCEKLRYYTLLDELF